MFSQFFISRPRFAFVISIVIVLVGLIALQRLPIALYPQITPPQVQVTATYPGANAEVIEATIASPIEAQVNGVEDMLYMSSTSANDGSYELSITFDIGTDSNLAAVNVQNQVALATAQLPEEVQRQGLSVRKRSTDMLQVYSLYSPQGTYDALFLSNYISINISDVLARVPGVGQVNVFGAKDYGMRIWLDPDRMTSLGITTADVTAAVRDQNIQAAVGQIGQAPAAAEQQFQYSVQAKGRLIEVAEFEKIIIRANRDGSLVRLGDIARIELGAQSYSGSGRLNGKPAVNFAIYQLPEANALDVAARVKSTLDQLAERFPQDVAYEVMYDTTAFIRSSLQELVQTLVIALLLVILVVYVFLQDWRSTLIPALALPVSLIGTFAVLLALGFSMNTITLFALVLAIGIVVDDAIVVIENVQRHMADGLTPVEATRRAMGEVTGPVITTTLVLLAVFVPIGFMPGITGQIYQQFAVTIAVAVSISSLNALTLSPALCATILRPESQRPWILLRGFNWFLDHVTRRYIAWTQFLLRRVVLTSVLCALTIAVTYGLFRTLPTGFLPSEDQGVVFLNIQLPDGASLPRTVNVLNQVEDIVDTVPGIANVMLQSGSSILSGSASNAGMGILTLNPWSERTTAELSLDSIMRRLQGQLGALPGATITAFAPPAIRGLGRTGGFEFQLQDRGGSDPQSLAAAARSLIYEANQHPKLQNVFTTLRADVPQVEVNLDRDKVQVLGIPLSDIFSTMQTQLGSLYINDFNKFGRIYRVMLQAETAFRDNPDDIGRLYVRSADGNMVQLRTLASVSSTLGPESLTRFNMFRSATINGSAAAGASSGDALVEMEALGTRVLPQGMGFEWSGLSLQEKQAGSQGPIILGLALLFVYLFLVAQYESWAIPWAVLLVVPVALLGALVATLMGQLSVDLYVQVALIMLVGLSTKQAILIVEFAKTLREVDHLPILEAATNAARLRFRAVMMTVWSFILGVLPLVVATGAGANARRSLGVSILGGMIAAAVLGTLLTPAFFVLIQKLRERTTDSRQPEDSQARKAKGEATA